MKLEHQRAIARKMNRLRMLDIASSMSAAARAITEHMELSGEHYVYRGSATSIDWLTDACREWEEYVGLIERELGIVP